MAHLEGGRSPPLIKYFWIRRCKLGYVTVTICRGDTTQGKWKVNSIKCLSELPFRNFLPSNLPKFSPHRVIKITDWLWSNVNFLFRYPLQCKLKSGIAKKIVLCSHESFDRVRPLVNRLRKITAILRWTLWNFYVFRFLLIRIRLHNYKYAFSFRYTG